MLLAADVIAAARWRYCCHVDMRRCADVTRYYADMLMRCRADVTLMATAAPYVDYLRGCFA